jgi:hypothetical protein
LGLIGEACSWIARRLIRTFTVRPCFSSILALAIFPRSVTAVSVCYFSRICDFWRQNIPTWTQAAQFLTFRYHTPDTPHSVGLLWTSDGLVAVTTQKKSVWNNTVPTGCILMELCLECFFRKSVEKVQVSLKSDKNNGYFAWRPLNILYLISFISSKIEKHFRQNKHLCSVTFFWISFRLWVNWKHGKPRIPNGMCFYAV